MLATAKEAITYLSKLDPEEDLVITWWTSADFKHYSDIDEAYSAADEALDVCIGHVNEWVDSQSESEEYDEDDEEEDE